MKKLVTFGDSWFRGVGAHWTSETLKEEYEEHAFTDVADSHSFRTVLCDRNNLVNVNFSDRGSSNQKQFRKASEYFIRDANIDNNSVVLWGLTSVFRTEVWHNKSKKYENLFLPSDYSKFSQMLAILHTDLQVEVERLYYQIELFNTFFKYHSIKNYWVNIFNEHNFPKKVDNLLFDGVSLLSILIRDYEENNAYHKSKWDDADRKITKAKEQKKVNPYTGHPGKDSHMQLANLLEKEIKF